MNKSQREAELIEAAKHRNLDISGPLVDLGAENPILELYLISTLKQRRKGSVRPKRACY